MPPAQAEPYAGKVLRGTATFVVEGTDGLERTVDVTVEEATGSASWAFLQVDVTACSKTRCTEGASYGKTLDAADFEATQDSSSATLATTFAGEDVSITWVRGGNTHSYGGDVGPPQHVSFGNVGDASVSASILGFSCNSAGVFGDMNEVYQDRSTPTPPGEPKGLPKGFAPRGKSRPSCA